MNNLLFEIFLLIFSNDSSLIENKNINNSTKNSENMNIEIVKNMNSLAIIEIEINTKSELRMEYPLLVINLLILEDLHYLLPC